MDSYNKRAKRFYENRKQQHDGVNRLHEMMQQGDVEQIAAYFAFALQQDDYSTDFVNKFQIDVADARYDPNKKQLCYAYRIPSKEEILTFCTFVYDAESDSIQPKPIDAKYQLVQRTHILDLTIQIENKRHTTDISSDMTRSGEYFDTLFFFDGREYSSLEEMLSQLHYPFDLVVSVIKEENVRDPRDYALLAQREIL